jgi:peptide/nickel transport system substrate-binding protein
MNGPRGGRRHPGRRMSRGRGRWGLVAVAIFGLVLAACPADEPAEDPPDGAETPEDEEPEREAIDVLRLAGGDFGHPSPFGYVRGPGMIHSSYVFDQLLWRDSTGEPIPWLAESWEVSDDGLEWRFTLRENVTFHDGEPLTVDDVVFTYDYMSEGPASDVQTIHGRGLEVVEEVVAEDDRTVVFHLARPLATFEVNIVGMWGLQIVPEHIWSDVDDPMGFRGPESTIGSGPYRLEEYDEGDGSYLYTANEDHFLGPPHVSRLEFVPAPDEVLALQRGEIHAAAPHEEGLPDEQLEALDAQFELLDAPGEWNLALHFNLDAGFPFDELDFRHAIAYGIDRQDLVDRILLGRGDVGSAGAMAPTSPWHADDLPGYEHDPEQANDLLDGLGMVDEDGDGWRQLPDGDPFTVELLASQRFSPLSGELMGEYLREIGIRTIPDVRDRAAADEAAGQGDYEMALVGYGGIWDDPDNLRTRFHPQFARGFSMGPGYEDPEFNELAESQLVTIDEDERTQLAHQMQNILAQDLPVLSLYVPHRMVFYDPEVFDAWYYTPGCPPCGATRNKHMYVTGQRTGLPEE